MNPSRAHIRSAAQWLAVAAGLAASTYAAYAGVAWSRYGRVLPPGPEEEDPLLDRFMPDYEVVERHRIRIAAPAGVTLAAARDLDLFGQPLVRAIFKGRELLLGAASDDGSRPRGLLASVQSLGWVVLDEVPDREIVVGGATRPWEPNPTFRSIPADEFAMFGDPGYVKIVWTLRADAISSSSSVFRTETRAVATDPSARRRFRRYWSCLSPGIILIRWASLAPLKKEAERRARHDQPVRQRSAAERNG
jgi:hypothetical protein